MSGLTFLDRLQTIVATVTVTSAVWILVGTVYVVRETGGQSGEPAGSARQAVGTAASANEVPVSEERLAIPVAGVDANELTDSFADDRGGRPHEAIDIMAPAGTPVVAAGPGTVEKLFLSEAGGNTVYIRSSDRRTLHYYAHLQDYASGLAEGQPVRRGQRLGSVGSTGNADPAAPHLHFAVLRLAPDVQWWEPATVAIDPIPLFISR